MQLKNLDNPAWINQIDSDSMLEKICDMPSHIQQAFELGAKKAIDINQKTSSVLFFGLGGSAIAGEIVQQELIDQSPIPTKVSRRSFLPKYVGAETLCVALSYSGNTKETLACYKEAIKKGADVVVITSGGELEQLAINNKNTVVKIPADFQPRVALGFLLGATIGVLSKTNLFSSNVEKNISQTTKTLSSLTKNYSMDTPISKNEAKQLAQELIKHVPLIYASESLGLTTANRWKSQLNENAKVMAFAHHFPELAHNEIMSTNDAADTVVIYLKNPDESADNIITNSSTLKIIKPFNNKIIEIVSEGVSNLSKMLSVIILGDYVSAYLAILREIDPTPVESISLLKKQLKRNITPKVEVTDAK